MKRTLIQKNDAKSLAGIIATILLSIYALSLLGLLLWGVIGSFKGALEFQTNLFGWPKVFRYDNYQLAFDELQVPISLKVGQRQAGLLEMFFWSVVTSIIPATINVVFTALCSYTLAKYSFGLRNTIYNILIIIMIVLLIKRFAMLI